jgi:hypothetical protein
MNERVPMLMSTMSDFHENPEQRRERLARIRQEITAGIYETTERLAAAVDALTADLEGRDDPTAGARRRPK